MCALSTRPKDHGDQKQAGMISSFSFTRGFCILVAAVSTCLLISCIYLEVPGLRPLGPEGSDESYVHEFSNFVFPKKVGHFLRLNMQNNDRHGSDVSVEYNSDTGIMLTVQVYPARRSSLETGKDPLEAHFQGVKGTVLRNSPDAQLISEGPARVTQKGKSYSGKMAVMTMEDFRARAKPSRKRPKGISELRVFRLGEHFIKYRMTYSEAIRGNAEKEIRDFMIRLKWPSEEG
jgi:hypothetical protein